ncbi:RNA 2',3'-cyclic phosphodiesterase [Infirmifilum lucidum]|uniref:RNA 2',3'-cyclic phosphodiesterase n=1 Tax=Infirmifilum lucidum TaxID=2776706 RepID=A0A7L9FH43_9CREN|nr:RNA 2',3'-cyclic phosphodiesterase [Infirmifilum lucidum]QOJ78264.1 RNA 2',3'-cyclic phosphodiesterase [Infirmifilum lucidum]
MSERILRVFVAVKVDRPEVVAKIKVFQEELERAGLKAKFVEAENLHITLQFIGEIPQEKVQSIKVKLREVRASPFVMELEGVGAFPSLKNPRVVWIGVKRGAEELSQLAHKVSQAILATGVRVEREEFIPHLTIARVKAPLNGEARRIIEGNSATLFGEQDVTRFYLVKSTLTPRGSIYTDLAVYQLT